MICAQCAAELAAGAPAACPGCGAGEEELLAGGRYRLDRLLGHGASGVTYSATRAADAEVVCVKELQFRRIGSLDVLKLFRREADILRQLDHPGIPRYVDDFTAGEGKTISLYLVQELIEGRNLQVELEDRRYREAEVLEVLAALLPILDYLHSLSPPVIHRDIKPSNVMRRDRDGSLVLIDFGAVKDVLRDSVVGGSTIVGTFGYTAPEQLYGRATPASDLYAVGALAVALLSRREPSELMDSSHRLRWQEHVRVSPATSRLLARLVEPDPGRRPQSAAAVRREVESALAALAADPPRLLAAPAGRAVAASTPAPDAWPPARKDRTKVAVAVVAVVASLGVVIGLCQSGSEGPSSARTRTCKAGPCKPVPQGLLGLSFGMSLETAQAHRPELAQTVVDLEPRESRTSFSSGMEMRFLEFEVPGARARIETGFWSWRASCELQFHLPPAEGAAGHGLSMVSCRLEPFDSEAAHAAAAEVIRTRYEEAYGAPERDQHLSGSDRWIWRDSEAVLTVQSRFDRNKFDAALRVGDNAVLRELVERYRREASSIVIENVAAEHRELMSSAEAAATARDREEQRLEAEEARREVEREKEKILRELGD